ncbi:MAG: ribosome-binding factor A [Gammaproteobacteria bacterium GWE2_37_16]|nr:MAG: ribosome-binding factor A [Gammaproteobacteria bacterium GWE2_37_16]
MSQKSYNRSDRVAQLVHHTIAEILVKHPEKKYFPSVTITEVKLSNDLSHAKVFFTTLDESLSKTIEKQLNHDAGFFRYLSAPQMNLRIVPQLLFIYDTTSVYGQKLSSLIDLAVTSDISKHKEDN